LLLEAIKDIRDIEPKFSFIFNLTSLPPSQMGLYVKAIALTEFVFLPFFAKALPMRITQAGDR
jgi:hypothetical protein